MQAAKRKASALSLREPNKPYFISLLLQFDLSLQLLTSTLRPIGSNLIDAVLGQLNTTLISPKNLPSPMVSNIMGSSCSETTSTVPR